MESTVVLGRPASVGGALSESEEDGVDLQVLQGVVRGGAAMSLAKLGDQIYGTLQKVQSASRHMLGGWDDKMWLPDISRAVPMREYVEEVFIKPVRELVVDGYNDCIRVIEDRVDEAQDVVLRQVLLRLRERILERRAVKCEC